jgi:hypothetical protein
MERDLNQIAIFNKFNSEYILNLNVFIHKNINQHNNYKLQRII